MHKESGFTLIEMLIVIAVIAVISIIAVPNLLSARLNANETAAVTTLRTISSAQLQFRAQAHNDNDGDGVGEYGYFAELSAQIPPRKNGGLAGDVITPPALSGTFRNIQDNGNGVGVLTRAGYAFQMFLPGAGGVPIAEDPAGGPVGVVDDNVAEIVWCCYAWPTLKDNSGTRAFVVNQTGDILKTDNVVQNYSGSDGGPVGLAAYSGGDMMARLSTNELPAPAQDTGIWQPVK